LELLTFPVLIAADLSHVTEARVPRCILKVLGSNLNPEIGYSEWNCLNFSEPAGKFRNHPADAKVGVFRPATVGESKDGRYHWTVPPRSS